jgi:hypothetical protein
MLRPNGVGLITFAGWGDFAGVNAALNPANPPAAAAETPAPAAHAEPAPAEAPPPPTDAILRHDDPRLSDARKKLLAEVDKRMGSVEGKPAAPGKTNLFDGTVHQKVGTTCGLLPGTVMKKAGVKGPIAACGTEGVRIEGRKLGVWVENDGTTLPKPGDIYVLRYPDTPETDSVAHVGVIWDVSVQDPALGELWITADSGQGSKAVQEAHLVNREMKKVDGAHFFLSGPKNTPGDSPLQRRIGGWVDLDKLLAA